MKKEFFGALLFFTALTAPMGSVLRAATFQPTPQLFFTKPFAGADPLPQTITVAAVGANFGIGVTASTSSGGNWLTIAPGCCNLSTPQSVTVTVTTPADMAVGSYPGQVVVTTSGATLTIPVTLAVVATTNPLFDTIQGQASFLMPTGGNAPPSQSVEIRNGGAGVLNWNLSKSTSDGGNWLNVSATSGTAPSIVNVSVTPGNLPGGGLTAGSYTGQILLQSATSSVTIPVLFTIGANVPRQINPLSFSKTFAGLDPLDQVVAFSSTGTALGIAPVAQVPHGGPSWLSVSPACCNLSTPGFFDISITTTPDMAAGSYTGQVVFDYGALAMTVPVILTISPPSNAFFDNVPGQLSFALVTRASVAPPNQIVEIQNAGSGTLNWTLTPTTSDGGNWLTVSANSGTAPSFVSVGIQIPSLPSGGLVAGVFSGQLLFRAPGTSVTVPITVVVAANILQQVNPLSFSKPQQGADPPPQTIVVASTTAGLGLSPVAVTATGGSWLSVTPACCNLSTPGTFTVKVTTPPTMAPGTYTGEIIFNSSGQTMNVPVTLTVSPTQQAFFDNLQGQMTFSLKTGSSVAPPTQDVEIRNAGSGTLNWSVTPTTSDGGNWLTVSANSGTAPSILSVGIQVANLPGGGLVAGTFTGNLLLTAPGTSITVPVNVFVGTNVFNQMSALSFTMPFGGANPLPQMITVGTTNATAIGISVSATTGTGGSWLSVSPTCCNLSTPRTLLVSVTASPTMAAGTYTGQVVVDSGRESLTVPVVLTVAAPTRPFFDNVQGQMAFSLKTQAANAPPNQIVQIRNAGSGTLNWTLTPTTADGGHWLTVSATTGTAPSQVSVGIQVANLPSGGLVAGTFTGNLLFREPGGSSVTIPVSVDVGANVFTQVNSLFFTMPVAGDDPLPQTMTIASTGTAIGIAPSVHTATGGNWLTVTPLCCNLGTTRTFIITVNTSPTMPAGTYTAEIVLDAGNEALTIPVTLTVGTPDTALFDNVPGQMSFSLKPAAAAPAAQSVTIRNVGAGILNWTLIATTGDGGNWLNVSSTSGTAPSTVTVNIVTQNLPSQGLVAGVFTGQLLFQTAGNSITIPVSVDVGNNVFNQLAPLTFTASFGGSNPLTQSITVTSQGTAIGYAVAATSGNGGAWLTMSPTCCNLGTPGTFTISAKSVGVAGGTYTGQLVFDNGGFAMTVPVTLNVTGGANPPQLGITKSHSGNFTQGQASATYTLTVSNQAGAGTTNGTVTATETVPTGLALVSMSGSGWTCNSNTCTRTDALSASASYPPITVTVSVDSNAPSQVTNHASVSGGGSTTATAGDPTNITAAAQPPPPVTVFTPAQGATGIALNTPLTWGAVSGATSYDVYFGTTNPPPFVTNTTGTTYSPTMSASTIYYWLIAARNAAGSTPSATWFFTTGSQTGTSGLQFVAVTPCRVMDTRNPTGTFGGPAMLGQTSRTVPIPQSSCNIPATARAYSLNITVVPHGGLQYLSIWPSGQAQPVVSTLNAFDGRIVANAAIVPAGTGGAISVFVSDTTDVIIDINGYFAPSSTANSLSFYSVTPCRVVDTRNPAGPLGGPLMSGGSSRSFPIPTSSCGVPGSALAYSFNVTVVPRRPLGYLTTWPTGQTQPVVSTLNSGDGSIVANAAIVPAGTGGAVSFFVTDDSDVIIDVNGYFAAPGSPAAQALYTVSPCRVADTRGGGFPPGFGSPSMAAGASRSFQVPAGPCAGIPASAQAYSLNVTVVPSGPLSYLTAWPSGQAQPVVSTLNSPLGKVVANAAIVPSGTSGAVSVFVTNLTDVILDINAYFAP
ncbi:MAG TPA: hypothetical protein VKU01_00270 [Bryobacteraceae bacterium]|nr:hypothetical protein [Bryobacteraceae bacterium]